jgi:DNA polymerase-3 subunit gamma/tau
MHLTQNCQVVALDGKVLTLGFSNAGARDSFDNGGSAEIVRQAAIDVVGSDWRIETIVDPGAKADPGAPRVTSPSTAPAASPSESASAATADEGAGEPPSWASDDEAPASTGDAGQPAAATDAAPPAPSTTSNPTPGPEAIAAARGAIQQTRQAGADRPRSDDLALADADAHPDDLDADTQGLDSAELLRRELGARVIDEIPHQ